MPRIDYRKTYGGIREAWEDVHEEVLLGPLTIRWDLVFAGMREVVIFETQEGYQFFVDFATPIYDSVRRAHEEQLPGVEGTPDEYGETTR